MKTLRITGLATALAAILSATGCSSEMPTASMRSVNPSFDGGMGYGSGNFSGSGSTTTTESEDPATDGQQTSRGGMGYGSGN